MSLQGSKDPDHPRARDEVAISVFAKFGPTDQVHVYELAAAIIKLCLAKIVKNRLWGGGFQLVTNRVRVLELDYVLLMRGELDVFDLLFVLL
jgi:hypothetical protein